MLTLHSASMVVASRTAPCTTTPAHPFLAASAAIWSPTSAQRSEPPPSMSNTRPCPCFSRVVRTSPLSSNVFSVTAGPWKEVACPKFRHWNGSSATSSGCESHRSAVAMAMQIHQTQASMRMMIS